MGCSNSSGDLRRHETHREALPTGGTDTGTVVCAVTDEENPIEDSVEGSIEDPVITVEFEDKVRPEVVSELLDELRGKSSIVQRNAALSFELHVFISSTFTDTEVERNILLQKILPELQREAAQYGIQVVFVDMRFGVKDENTKDHQTWIACETELVHCMNKSRGIYFLSLQGEKYGYRPLPKYIARQAFEAQVGLASAAIKALAEEWYHLDLNFVEPQYVLKALDDASDAEYWNVVLPTLLSALEGITFGADALNCTSLEIGQSVTDWETRAALSAPESCVWIRRGFTDNDDVFLANKAYCDVCGNERLESRLRDLQTTMHTQLAPTGSVVDVAVDAASLILQGGDAFVQYQVDIESVMRRHLASSLRLVIQDKRHFDSNGWGLGIPGPALSEMLHHSNIRAQKSSDFIGREELVEEALVKITTGHNAPSNRYGVCLALVGVSGAGKTALMSQLAHHVSILEERASEQPPRPVIVRYCGTSSESLTAPRLLNSICLQIQAVLGVTDNIPSDFDMLVKHFHSLLERVPIVLFIDSLDQLKDEGEARSKLKFLDGLNPHSRTRLILSTLPDERDQASGRIVEGHWYGSHTCLVSSAASSIVTVPLLSQSDTCELIIAGLLERQGRRLTADQMAYAVQQALIEPTVLYCRMLVLLASRVRSLRGTAVGSDAYFVSTVPGIITQIFDGLEKDFGKEVVRFALGCITFSVEGINDTEMQDLMTLDEKVMKAVFEYWRKEESSKLPMHVWLRIRSALESLVVEKDSGKLKFYHRQLQETAESRFDKTERLHYHRAMAEYFGNLANAKSMQPLVSMQPLSLSPSPIWFQSAKVNKARCIEGAHSMIAAGMHAEAIRELCNPEAVCAYIKSGEGFTLINRLIEISRHGNEISSDEATRVDHYLRWLRQDMYAMLKQPSQFIFHTCSASQPSISVARIEVERYLNQANVSFKECLQVRSGNQKLTTKVSNVNVENSWIRSRVLGKAADFDPLLMDLKGHTGSVRTVCFSSDGSRIVSGSWDETVKVWDGRTGECLRTLQGHASYVLYVCCSRDGSRIVSWANDSKTKVWSATTAECSMTQELFTAVCCDRDSNRIVFGNSEGAVFVWDVVEDKFVTTMEGHTCSISSAFCTDDCSRIVSGSEDCSIKVWDVKQAACVKTFAYDYNRVSTMSCTPHCDLIAATEGAPRSGCYYIRIWNVESGECIASLGDFDRYVMAMCFNRDGSLLASSNKADNTIKVWSIGSGKCLRSLEGHMNLVDSLSFNQVDNRLVSGSEDDTIKVWDADTAVVSSSEVDVEALSSVCFNHDGSRVVCGYGYSKRYSGVNSETIKIFDTVTGECVRTLKGSHSGWVTAVCYNHDSSRVLSCGARDGVKVWDIQTGKCLWTIEGHTSCFSPDGSQIASGVNNTIKIWDAKSGKCLRTLKGHIGIVSSLCFDHSCSRLISGSSDAIIKVWDARTVQCVWTLQGHTGGLNSMCCNRDGSRIVSGSSDGAIKMWDLRTGECLRTLQGHVGDVFSVCFNRDGRRIISGSKDTTVMIWDTETGINVLTLKGHTDRVCSVCCSPDDTRLASCGWDKTVVIYDLFVLKI